MYYFQHVLVATDFGSSSLRAVHVAAELANRLAAHLTVLHVIHEAPPAYGVEAQLLTVDTPEARERAAKVELDAYLESLAHAGRPCAGVVRFGDPAQEIVAYAEEAACDVIVVGTHGRRGLTRWLLGSVAEKLVRSSHIPVLTVRADGEEAREEAGAATAADHTRPRP